jgi:alpha-L-rhamnosidase
MKLVIYNLLFWFYVGLVLILAGCTSSDKGLLVSELRCCDMADPDGIHSPRLSWKIKTIREEVAQKSWEIQIATSRELLLKGKAEVWKSGVQQSDDQFNIIPENVNFAESTGYFWRVRISDNKNRVSSWSNPAYFSIGLLDEKSWTAKWLTYRYAKDKPLPYFRKVFNPDKEGVNPEKATVYFCGLGAGELYLNGQQVDSTRFLDPAQTNYEQYALYSTFDVTDQLKPGMNCLGVMLGNGWFSQDEAWQGAPFSYGSPMFRLQMVVLYSDGSRSVWGSDEDWQWKEGPVLKSNIYLGEQYDARREIEAWCNAETTCADWNAAIVAHENVPPHLLPQLMEPIRKKQVLKADSIWQDRSGKWIFDFGENIAGIPFLNVEQPRGTHLTIRIAEEKNADGSLDFTSLGWVHHGKIFTHEYTCKGGGREQLIPRFTYHGFRYAELSGMIGNPNLSTLSLVVVHNDLPVTGTFECSDSQINRLHELAVRTVLSNLHGIPTDCPNREKCGWLGDTHAYVKMANLNLQMNNFWMNYLENIRFGAAVTEGKTLFHERYNNTFYFTEKPAGLPYMIAPGKRLCGVASPDWGTALVQLPWWLYVYYGNKEVLKNYYPDMKQWTNYVTSLASNPDRTQRYNRETKHIVWQGLGDWCPPAGDSTLTAPVEFTSSAFHYLDVCIMEQVARILEKMDDIGEYQEEKKAIAQEMISIFYDNDRKTYGSQTADALALDFGLVPAGDEITVAEAIGRNIKEKSNGFIHCGIFGIGRIGSMLARNGNAQAAGEIFTKKGENSFEWMWKGADATSLWETLPVNELTKKRAMSDSHNHPMQAGYDACFYEDIAGIRPDPKGYGFKVIRFEPLFCNYVSWAKASIRSPYGDVSSSWIIENDKFEWKILIPANSSGWVVFPFKKNIVVNGKRLEELNYKSIENTKGEKEYMFPSGHFFITISSLCI